MKIKLILNIYQVKETDIYQYIKYIIAKLKINK